MMTIDITLRSGTMVDPAVAAAGIVRKCRQCKSKVCISRGEIKNADGRSLNQVYCLATIHDPHITIVISGKDELRVMCDLVDMVNHGTGI